MFWLIALLLSLIALIFGGQAREWLPMLTTLVSVVCSVFFSFKIKSNREDRIQESNLLWLLRLYREDLENGLRWIREHQATGRPAMHFPIASWQMQKLGPEQCRILGELPNQKIFKKLGLPNCESYDETLATLPTHLKNCFDHVAFQYNHENHIFKSGSFGEAIEGVQKTIDGIDSAVLQLAERTEMTGMKNFFLARF